MFACSADTLSLIPPPGIAAAETIIKNKDRVTMKKRALVLRVIGSFFPGLENHTSFMLGHQEMLSWDATPSVSVKRVGQGFTFEGLGRPDRGGHIKLANRGQKE